MTYVEATMDGTATALIDRLRRASVGACRLRLREADWLARDEFRRVLAPVLDEFRARGGTVEQSR